MEVQGRPVPALTLVALVAAVAAAVTIVVSQPFRSPWWTYADADGAYTATGLQLLAGGHAKYLDHPGLPLDEVLAITFGADWLAHGGSRTGYVHDRLLHLDRTRPYYRGWGVVFFLAGAVMSTLVARRLYRSWWLAAAGGLLWVGSPGLAEMSIQFRPDVIVTALSLLVAFLIALGARGRSTRFFALAALALGLATMVKMHSAGLVVPLALALVLRSPREDWRPHWNRRAMIAIGLGWGALAVALNWSRFPFRPTAAQLTMLVLSLAVLLAGLAVRRPLGTIAASLIVGLLIPVTLDLRDGLQSLVVVARGLTGGGANTGISYFSTSVRFGSFPLREACAVFAVAVVAAVCGVVRRDPEPGLFCLGAAVLGLMAYARLGTVHYFAPAFIVSVPAALWLCRRLDARLGVALAVALTAYVVVPQFQHRSDASATARAERAAAEPALRAAAATLKPGEVALTPPGFPVADTRWFGLVQTYLDDPPRYPYRFLPDTSGGRKEAAAEGLAVALTIPQSR